jgi:outer membrane protein assembly factor BamB
MKNLSKAKLTATIVLFLLMASVTLMAMPVQPVQAQLASEQPNSGDIPTGSTANATVETNAYLSFRPNPVGVGQTFLVNIWVTPAPAAQRKFLEFTVTITKPDGTEEVITMDSYVADGTAWFEYVADQNGTWTIKFEFLGTYLPAGRYYNGYIVTNTSGSVYDSCYYEPSETAEQTLVVQEEQVSSWPESALPTDYWTRPVAYEHREWASILGDYPWTGTGDSDNWPEGTNTYASNYQYTPYVQAPNTAHVVWKRQFAIAGILGGDYGYKITDSSIFENTKGYNPSIVYAGRAYQSVTKVFNGASQSVWQCYDIRTGEIYWEQTNVTRVPTVIEYAFGQLGGGGGASDQTVTTSLVYIGSGLLVKYNPMTGAMTGNYSISPLTTGTYYKDGYALSVQTISTGNYRLINWTTTGTLANLTTTTGTRIISNITWPVSSLPTCVDYEAGIAASASAITKSGAYVGMTVYAVSLTTGQLLWNITLDGEIPYSGSCNVADHGIFAILTTKGYYLGLDLYTGKEVWTSDVMDYPWDASGFGAYSVQSAYGLFYRQAYSGIYAFDWDDGSIVWKFEAPANAYETPYVDEDGVSVYSWNIGAKIADGKLYTYTTEHSATVPITRGWGLYCINATTGEGIWNVTLPGASSKHSTDIGAIADGYLTVFSSDGYMYVYGKGQSETTIEAPLTAITLGESLVITGTVLDQSPAQAGTACVSTESMGAWMGYLHKQLAIPADVTGVSVSLDTVDPNGNYVHIADVTTDMSGTFSYMWEPEIAGKYTVTATFMGDDSYGSSYAETAVGVVDAPEATATPEPQAAAPDSIPYVVGIGIAMILTVAIATVLILRKRA